MENLRQFDKNKKLLIYLADPTHDGAGKIAIEIFPYNVGLIASYAKKIFGDALEIKLFKYVSPLIQALKNRPPHILGCSNYMWNSNLSEFLLGRAKSINPMTLTVQGGTNYPFDAAGQYEFLSQHPNTDFHIFYEGEKVFVNLINAYLACSDPRELREHSISGLQSISPTTGQLVSGKAPDRIKDLDEIPSPYATGLLDDFFDGCLVPLLETNRGCPFTCNFCNAGTKYYTKINQFSLPYLKEEWEYIAPRIAKSGVSTVIFADNNFGMYPRDAELCQILKNLQDTYGWPHRIVATTGKNNKARIIKATEILGTGLNINMSAQSMTPEVLKNIKRSNISLDAYKEINKTLLHKGRIQKGELIACLPGETFESFMESLGKMMETGTQQIYNYTLELLYGTPYKEPAYRKEWGYEGKWRIVAYNFGQYDGERMFDLEEVAVQSKTMPFEDYLKIRLVCLLTESMYNEYQYYEIIKYLGELGLSPLKWLWKTLNNIQRAPQSIRKVVESFMKDTRAELFDSERQLFDFYRQNENYQKLLKAEAGHNVVFTHKGLIISHLNDWLPFIVQMCLETILDEKLPNINVIQVKQEIECLMQFLSAKWRGVLKDSDTWDDVALPMDYDVKAWLNDFSGKTFKEFKLKKLASFRFYFTPYQIKQKEEDMRRYGYDRVGLARLYARGLSSDLFRHIERDVEVSY